MTQDAKIREILDLKSRFAGELRVDSVARKIYSTDASAYQEIPLAVAIPQTPADIKLLIQLANRIGVGLIPRTAGTSLAGQVVGAGIVVDVSRHFNKILAINPDERWVRVQPGVIRNELNKVLAPYGMMFGPETSTANRAMLGGMLGNNSCGSNSIVYGSTRDHTLEVQGFLSDGSEATFQAMSAAEFESKCAPNNHTLESNIYRGTRDLLADPATRAEIVREFPKPEIHRRNTGYAVDLLMNSSVFPHDDSPPSRPFNFCTLIAGSEGTLFFATEIKLNCVPLPPPSVGLLCAHFESLDQALRATQIAMDYRISGCELMDHFVLEGANRNLEQRENAAFIEGTPAAILIVEARRESIADVVDQLNTISSRFSGAELGYAFSILLDGDTQKVWELRRAGLGILGNVPGDRKPCAVIEDTAVSINDLPAYIAEFNQILRDKHGLQCVHYAHAGAGEIHLRPILNLKTEAGNEQFRELASDIATLVKKYRGSLSGEHGDGRLRAEFLQRMIGEKNYQLLKEIKRLWDPNGIFNPRKIVDAPPMNTGLRYQPGQPNPAYETIFSFELEQGVLRAAEFCNGSGDCRKTHLSGGTMCPSYMATLNESETTRARANMLRHVLTNPADPSQPFNSEEIKQVMDLCLSCKGCKRECPSNVDVAKLKAEFLQGYYDANGVPARAKRIAGFADQMKLAAKFPRLFNFMFANDIIGGWLKRYAGFSTKRSIPKLSKLTLRTWFKRHEPHPNAGSAGKVLLFCDEFTNFLDSQVGQATVELLEQLGFAVEIPDHSESGRAAISKGLLRQSKAIAEENVRKLAPRVSENLPLIGIEPSALLGFRDEYPQLVSDELKEPALKLAEHTFLVDEFIDRLIHEQKINSDAFGDESRTIRLHGHCHQKALASLAPTVRMLQLPTNYTVRLIPSGCCGMAGSFGYEKEHYDISMEIGELILFPTVRSEPGDHLIAAAGTSCRHQIVDGTGRIALHPAQILRLALTP